MWTPAEWAWIAGSTTRCFPLVLRHAGAGHRFAKFDPERAFAMLASTRWG